MIKNELRGRQNLEHFLIEIYGQGNGRSAAVYSTSQYYRIYFYNGDDLIADRMLFDKHRAKAEAFAYDWIMERVDESEVNQLYKTLA